MELRLMEQVITKVQQKVMEVYQHIHANPEISWQEQQTTKYIEQQFIALGLAPQLLTPTGLYVDIGVGTPQVGIRVDLDALWQEVDGVFQANHSCGHDGHIAMGIGAAMYVQQQNLQQAIRIIFQPAEEKAQGAKAVVAQGVIDHLQFLFGIHVRPIKELPDGQHAPAIYHGAAKLIQGTITGIETHGARPELGINAIEVGAAIIEGLQKIWADPNVSSSIKVTQFQGGGSSTNIIPGQATFSIDARAQTNEVMEQLMEGLTRVLRGVEALYQAKIVTNVSAEIVAAQVDELATQLLTTAIHTIVGQENCAPSIVSPGGEDFHFYTYERPSLKATMLGLGCAVTPGLHHPNMTFNTERLHEGAQILAEVASLATMEVES